MSEIEPGIINTIEADVPVSELPPIEEEEAPQAEPTIEPTQEIKHVEPLTNNSKTQARNEKKITCQNLNIKIIQIQPRTQLPRTIRI